MRKRERERERGREREREREKEQPDVVVRSWIPSADVPQVTVLAGECPPDCGDGVCNREAGQLKNDR